MCRKFFTTDSGATARAPPSSASRMCSPTAYSAEKPEPCDRRARQGKARAAHRVHSRLELEVLVVECERHQRRRVREALQHGVEKTGVAQVAQAGANLRRTHSVGFKRAAQGKGSRSARAPPRVRDVRREARRRVTRLHHARPRQAQARLRVKLLRGRSLRSHEALRVSSLARSATTCPARAPAGRRRRRRCRARGPWRPRHEPPARWQRGSVKHATDRCAAPRAARAASSAQRPRPHTARAAASAR